MNNEDVDRCVIEFSGEALGLVIRDEQGFVFFATAEEVRSLNRRVFKTVDAAVKASLELLRRKRDSALRETGTSG